MRKLLIISHTEHYIGQGGEVRGLSSTVKEINHFLKIFDVIVHVAMLYDTLPPRNTLPYDSERITFRQLPALGGKKVWEKVRIICNAPKVLKVIVKELKKCDVFQFRAPTGIGVFIIPYLIVFSKKNGWFKYAGNWQQKNVPLTYRFQRWLVSRQSRIVTINGTFADQPKQCISFENPCLTLKELKKGNSTRINKEKPYSGLELCFVGRLEKKKGLDLFLDALKMLSGRDKKRIKKVHIVGDGDINFYKNIAAGIGIECEFHGLLPREAVQEVYIRSHAKVLPSFSEGFPKVITEAMNYGALPIISKLPSLEIIVQHKKNGITLRNLKVEHLSDTLFFFIKMSNSEYKSMITSSLSNLERFTYTHYMKRIKNEVTFLS